MRHCWLLFANGDAPWPIRMCGAKLAKNSLPADGEQDMLRHWARLERKCTCPLRCVGSWEDQSVELDIE